jgi:hypothetical protein
LFAGIALDGAALQIDDRSNTAIYGGDVTPRAIFEGRVQQPPTPIVDFRDRLEEYSASKRFQPSTPHPQQPAQPPSVGGPTPPDTAQTVPLKGG